MSAGLHPPEMDDQRLGAALRASRVHRRMRQVDVARAAGVSRATISRVERGHLDHLALSTIRSVGRALDVRMDLVGRSRGADLDRLANGRHAALAEQVARDFGSLRGWVVRPEVSFAIYGERGVVDLLAWHEGSRSLLVVELKTEIVDVGEILATLDRKVRVARVIARDVGWAPLSVSCWLAIGHGATNRRRVSAHLAVFSAALADRAPRLRAWLADPTGVIRALSFVADARPGDVRAGFATVRRVTRPRSR